MSASDAIKIDPLTLHIGAEISGVDLSQPLSQVQREAINVKRCGCRLGRCLGALEVAPASARRQRRNPRAVGSDRAAGSMGIWRLERQVSEFLVVLSGSGDRVST